MAFAASSYGRRSDEGEPERARPLCPRRNDVAVLSTDGPRPTGGQDGDKHEAGAEWGGDRRQPELLVEIVGEVPASRGNR